MTTTSRRTLYWGVFALWCAISIAGISFGIAGLAPNKEPGLAQAIWLFYAPAWILSNALFGGIHGAPAWSFWPSIVLAVLVQSGLIWALGSWLYRLWRHRSKAQ